MCEESLQIAEEREAKVKGERERYIQLNAEFQTIIRTDTKAFLCEQCKEIQENNRRGQERSEISSRHLEIIKGIFNAKMDTVKDRKHKD